MRHALIDSNGNVTNIILVAENSGYACPEGLGLIPLDEGSVVGIGWQYEEGEWIDTRPPPDPDPPVTPEPIRQQSPDGTWWEQRINNAGQATWVRAAEQSNNAGSSPQGTSTRHA